MPTEREPMHTVELVVSQGAGGIVTPKPSPDESQEAHERRVARLEASGWERVGEGDDAGWSRDTGDPRWAKTSVQVIEGAGFFENTRAAWGIQVRNEAEDIRTEALRPQR